MRLLFGTDGVRGVANQDLTVHLALRLARAAATVLRRHQETRPRVVIGRDTRISGDMLEAALVAGFCSAGADVIPVGVIPTAGVAYLTRTHGADIGAVISASHNPFGDNGIKFFCHDGFKLPDAVELEIEARMNSSEQLDHPLGAEIGRQLDGAGFVDDYLDYLWRLGPGGLSGLRLVVDCANGAAAALAPRLFSALGAEVIPLCCEPDGININDGCGATHPEVMAAAVVDAKADVGIAFDGDADRLIMADEQGRIVDGDRIMAIAAIALHAQGRLPDGTVVGTVMSNLGLERGLEARGLRLVRTPVGDRYVLEQMQALGASLGGEQSGHLIFLDHATTGDGLVSALMILNFLRAAGDPFSVLADVITEYPQRLVNVKVATTNGWQEHVAIQQAIALAEDDLGDTGRILVRASGTEPKIRVMVEAQDEAKVTDWTDKLAGVVREAMGSV